MTDLIIIALLLVAVFGWTRVLQDIAGWIGARLVKRQPGGEAWVELHDNGDGSYEARICGRDPAARETAKSMVAFRIGWDRAIRVECERNEARHVH